MDLSIIHMQLFDSQDINWWTGVMWFTCGLLWCFYLLFGLSFWRHPFTADDPLVSKWCNAKFPQICSDKEANSSTFRTPWLWENFQQFFFWGWSAPLRWIACWIEFAFVYMNKCKCWRVYSDASVHCDVHNGKQAPKRQ